MTGAAAAQVTDLRNKSREVSVIEARELFDTRRPVVLDVRERDAFDQGRIRKLAGGGTTSRQVEHVVFPSLPAIS